MDIGGDIINDPLVEREKIVLPPLHMKLGYMKQFVKTIEKTSHALHV